MRYGKWRRGLRTDIQLQNSAARSSIGTGLRPPPPKPTWYSTFLDAITEEHETLKALGYDDPYKQ